LEVLQKKSRLVSYSLANHFPANPFIKHPFVLPSSLPEKKEKKRKKGIGPGILCFLTNENGANFCRFVPCHFI